MGRVKEQIRQQIKEQRRHSCDQCGIASRDGHFCFQRKLNRKKYPNLANEPDNIRMLCQGCNEQWEAERAANRRPSAKVNSKFRKRIRAERGDRCEICGQPSPNEQELTSMPVEDRSRRTLHLHHRNKQRTHPQIRCDRGNIILCCQSCHVQLEAELNVQLREQSAVESHSVGHSENAGATYNSITADRKSAARVELRGEVSLSPENCSLLLLRPKVAGAQRPKAQSDEKNVRNESKPKLEQAAPVNCVLTNQDPQDVPTLHEKPKDCAYTNPAGENLNLKLRMQAKKMGLIPGSARWRAYVLGTVSATKKRKRKDGEPKLTGGVTPVNCTRLVTTLSDNRTRGSVE